MSHEQSNSISCVTGGSLGVTENHVACEYSRACMLKWVEAVRLQATDSAAGRYVTCPLLQLQPAARQGTTRTQTSVLPAKK